MKTTEESGVALGACIPSRFRTHAVLDGLTFVEITVGDALVTSAWGGGLPCWGLRRIVPDDLTIFDARDDTVRGHIAAVGRLVQQLEVRTVTLGSGPARAFPKTPDAELLGRWRCFLAAFRDVVNCAGARLLLEPLSPEETNNVNNLGEAVEYLDVVDGVTLDIEHVGNDPFLEAFLAAHADAVTHVHLSGRSRRAPSGRDWPRIERFLSRIWSTGVQPSVAFEVPWLALVKSLPEASTKVREMTARFG